MGSSGVERRRAGRVPSRTVTLVLVIAAVAGLAGAAYSQSRRGEHTAEAVIMLHPLAGNAYSPGGRGDELTNLETEAQVLRSEAVAQAVLRTLGEGGSPVDLLAAIEVRVPPNTQLLEISARGPDDRTATARASAFAEVYLEYRRARTQSATYEQTSRLSELVDARTQERSAALSRLQDRSTTTSQRPVLEQQAEELTLQISSLRAQLVAAESGNLDPGQIVTPGRARAEGVTANPAVMGAAVAMAVLLAGFAALVARAGRAGVGAIRSTEDLAGLAPPALGPVRAPLHADDETVALARSAVLTVGAASPRVIAVARADRGHGILQPALVAALTRARYHVVSVDLGRHEDVTAMAQLVNDDVAVDDLLVEDRQFLATLRPSRPVGAHRNDAEVADLTSSAGMTRGLHDVAKRADLVVVRCPGFGTPVGRAILTAVAAAVVEVVPGQTRRADVEAVITEAERAGCEVVGFVLVTPAGSQPRGRQS